MTVDIILTIRTIVRRINLESKQIEKEYGITITQLLCLTFLAEQNGHQCSSGAIKDYLQLNASTVTGIIDRLIIKGYVVRLPKKDDKRVSRINLTESGEKIVKSSPSLLQEKLASKLETLPGHKKQSISDSLKLLSGMIEAISGYTEEIEKEIN